MPCYLFTYHAHGSWMPDRTRGYVHRGTGILAPDKHMAQLYRRNLKQSRVSFNPTIQHELIDGTLEASKLQEVRCHAVATEASHFHVLVSWKTDRTWQLVRKQIRGNITRRLNGKIRRQKWFAKSPSRKRVRDRKHFDYLIGKYLPDHRGLKWTEGRGIYK